jgi:hypothetical protein
MKKVVACVIICTALMCSHGPEHLAGGTIDTGNAKISGRVHTPAGGFAAGASVTVCPAGYLTALGADSTANRLRFVKETTTDDSGRFRIDTIDKGVYRIEVNDGKSSAVLLDATIDTTPVVFDTGLSLYATVKGNAGRLSDTAVKRYVLVYGLDRRVPVGDNGSFSIDLPTGEFRFRIAVGNSQVAPVDLDSIATHSEDTVSVPFAGWSHRARITLNTSASGAGVDHDVFGFPVLVRLSKSNFQFGQATGSGGDCRFAKPDGSTLAFEIEQWDSSRSSAAIWVRVDTVFGGNITQSFDMLWGNSRVAAISNSAAVFDTGNGFMGSYHFNGDLSDATFNRFTGVDNTTTDMESGLIGRGRGFNGSSQYFQVDHFPDRPCGTISCWLKPRVTFNSSTQATQGIWGKKSSDSLDFSLSLRGTDFWVGPGGEKTGGTGNLFAKLETTDTGYYLASSTSSFSAGVWYYVSWTWGNGNNYIYVNGTPEGSDPHSLPVSGPAIDEIGRSFYDGSNILGGGPLYFSGTLDELRMDNRLRSADWIKLCYMNQRQDDKLVTFAPQ